MDNNVILIYLFKKKIFPNNRNLQTYIYIKKKTCIYKKEQMYM